MIDYIDAMWSRWATYMKKNPKCWPSESPSWRLYRDHGAKAQMTKAREPKGALQIFSPQYADVAQCHRLFRVMPEHQSNLVVVEYMLKGRKWTRKRKAELLGLSCETKMYEHLQSLHSYCQGRFDEIDSGNSPPKSGSMLL